ncbi:MAG: Gfo/Idh/MocA family oxidoreductase [Gemmatimonadota bacterium]|nr:Gfo/Idh/MocA family oxidoreductase [Gemmatimonadota bacterium]
MDSIRLGLVGSGGMARSRAGAFSELQGCRLTALAARNPRTGAELARQYCLPLLGGWEDLVGRSDVDAVVVCTSNDSHGPIARASLEAGKPVFLEYPLARHVDDGTALVELARSTGTVLRVAHPEVVSGAHRQLREAVGSLGGLLLALFVRLTPGRGARPEVLFNIHASGPPSLFFVYQVFPLVDLFGPASWVEGYAHYDGMDNAGTYERFVNRVAVGFTGGGTAEWTWAGGISIGNAEQVQRFVLEGGTLIQMDAGWRLSSADGKEFSLPPSAPGTSLESLFLEEVHGRRDDWRSDLDTALEAVRIGLGAEEAAKRGGRIHLGTDGTSRLNGDVR